MAGSTAEITWTSKDEAVVRSLEKTERGLDKLARKLDNIEKTSKKATDSVGLGFDAATAKIGQFAQGIAGVGSVMGGVLAAAAQLRREWETLKNQQKGAADANLALADVLPAAVRNAGGILGAREVEAATRKISQTTGAGEVKVAQAIGDALAARGATNKAQAMDAIAAAEAAIAFAPEADSGTMAALAGGTTDLQRRFGATAKQSIGFLARVGGQARVTSLRDQVQNLNPAIGGVVSYGGTAAEAGGLVSVLTGATGDFTGATSATAALQLASQLQKAGFGSTAEGVRALQGDARLRERFLKTSTFDVKASPAIKELLTGGSKLGANYWSAVNEIGGFAQGGQTYDQMIRDINGLDSVRLANLRRRIGQAGGALRLADVGGAEGSISREGLSDVLDASGLGALDQQFVAAQFEAVTGGGTVAPTAFAARKLRERAAYLTRTTESNMAGPGAGGVVPRRVSERDTVAAEILQEIAGYMEQFVREQKTTNAELKGQTSEMRSERTTPRQTVPPSAALGR